MSEQGQFSAADIDSAPPQQKTGQFSAADIDPPAKTWTQQLADYPKGIWENLVQTGQGMVNLATTDPRETIKGIGAAQDALRVKALDAFKKGDYVTAGRHALEYLIPMAGPQMGEMGDLAQRGEVGRALGQATSLGGQMALPGALHANAPAIVSGVEQAPAAIKGAAQATGTAIKGGVKGAAQAATEMVPFRRYGVDVSLPKPIVSGAAMAAAGRLMGLPPEAGAVVGAAAPIVRGAFRGAKTALADRVAAGLEAQRAARVAAAARATPEAPVGLLGAGRTITPEAPPDTSYVRSVPAEYPQPEAVPPKALLGPGPERIITPPAPEDTSYVRSVPAEYPQGEGAPPAAPAAAAPAAPDPALLEGLAQANFKKPFAKLAAADQQTIRDTASAIGRKIPEETRGPLPKFREGSESLGEPQPATQGKTIEQIVQEELDTRRTARSAAAKEFFSKDYNDLKPSEMAAIDQEVERRGVLDRARASGVNIQSPTAASHAWQDFDNPAKAAEAPVSEQPAGRPDVESKPVQEPQGLTEEPESVPNLEQPRSQFLASGERKSSLLRAEEIKASNTTAKAKRYAEALHGFMTANQLQLMPKSRWPAVTNDLIIRGLLDKDEVPPNTSIPQIVSNLRELELAANKAKLTPAAAPVKKPVPLLNRERPSP